jgi:hypothetical protein
VASQNTKQGIKNRPKKAKLVHRYFRKFLQFFMTLPAFKHFSAVLFLLEINFFGIDCFRGFLLFLHLTRKPRGTK